MKQLFLLSLSFWLLEPFNPSIIPCDNLTCQSNTSSRIVQRNLNESQVGHTVTGEGHSLFGRGDGMEFGIASKFNTREYGRVGQYKR